MRLNWETRVLGARVALQPFIAPYVPKYHDWMEDAWLRDMTASERLSLPEEFEMQAAWVEDDQKATFIVFDRAAMSDAAAASDAAAGGAGRLPGAPAAVQHTSIDLSAEPAAQQLSPIVSPLTGDTAGMIGDVNLFLLPHDEAREYGAHALTLHGCGSRDLGAALPASPRAAHPSMGGANAAAADGDAAAPAAAMRPSSSVSDGGGELRSSSALGVPAAAPSSSDWTGRAAEIMIMVAEPGARRQGVAVEAAQLMMEWGRRHLGITCFVAKISESNAASLALFTRRLGFREAKRVAAFSEVHLVSPPLQAAGAMATTAGAYREERVAHAYAVPQGAPRGSGADVAPASPAPCASAAPGAAATAAAASSVALAPPPPPTWLRPLTESIRSNRSDRASSWVQLATVGAGGRPAVRTVVHRGLLTLDPQAPPCLSFVTDARSGKVAQLAAGPPWGEIAWYFGISREQWRIAGRLGVVTAAGHVGYRDPLWTAGALEDARRAAWVHMSDAGRSQFAWPHPGHTRTAPDDAFIRALPLPAAAAGGSGSGGADAGGGEHGAACGLTDVGGPPPQPPDSPAAAAASPPAAPDRDALDAAYAHFGLLLLCPDACDWLCLKFKPTQRRALHELVATADGSCATWRVREVNP